MALFNYECDEVKRKILEVSPNYPQLTTYTSEWLYFYEHEYTPGTPVDLEYQEVIVNPIGRVDNAIPYNYKSAILKGSTWVNLVNDVTSYEVGNYTSSLCKINVTRNLQNETLTIIFNVTSLEIPKGADGVMRIGGGWSGTVRHKPTLGVNKILYKYTEKSNNMLGVYSNSGAYNLGQRITISEVMVLEGDYTQEDIPYFEGVKSVQMPVLTTTNADDTKTNILTVNEDVILRSNGNVYDELNLLNGCLTQRIGEDGEVLAQAVVKTVELTPLNKPYEGVNHYHLSANIPCEAILEVPIVSSGEQTLQEINND